MGEVFLAQDTVEQRSVALKFLHRGLGRGAVEDFKEEVRLLSRLSHPNLVKIYDYLEGQGEAGPCFSMEYIPGVTLDRLSAPVPAEQWIQWFIQLIQGLHYLHRRQILHGDLKPSNLLVTEGQEIKLLDFGLAALRSRQPEASAQGTLAYMPPEAFWGDYDAQSDLFSVGVLFYEVLAGRLPFSRPLSGKVENLASPGPLSELRPDLPQYFCDLVHRLLEISPSRRPPSALSLLKFLQQHVETPFALLDDADSQLILQKAPWIGRLAETQQFWQGLESGPSPRILDLSGPTGVGRSRFLEEMKWQIQLKGWTFLSADPGDASQWMQQWRDSLALGPHASATADLLETSRALLRDLPAAKIVAFFTDLHLWPASALQKLGLFLRLPSQGPVDLSIVLEYASDIENEGLGFLRPLVEGAGSLELKDLSEAETRELVRRASVDAPLQDALVERIAHDSGGRPLLALEAIRHFMAEPNPAAAEPEALPLPKNLQEVTALRVQSLSHVARELLSLVIVSEAAVPLHEARDLLQASEQTWDEARLALESQGFLTAHSKAAALQLAHPSLRDAFLQSISPEVLRAAHRRWLKRLENAAVEGQDAGEKTLTLYRHAEGAEEIALLKKWGKAAAEYLQSQQRFRQAIQIWQRLYQEATTAFERTYSQAMVAPLYYREGKFNEAIHAYDLWIKDREDDETLLQKMRHHFYIGLVLHTAGKLDAAHKRLQECLDTGDSARHEALRPFHARARVLLASLDETKNDFDGARRHLEQALTLAQNQPVLMGDIEQRLGRLAQKDLDYPRAKAHFERSREYFRTTQNPQAEAIALNLLAMLHLESGQAAEAGREMQASLECARRGGDLPQWARYRVNYALIWLDGARYSEAMEALEEGRLLLRSLGNSQDQILTEIHRLSLYAAAGNWDRSLQILSALKSRLNEIAQARALSQFFQAVGEMAYLRGRWAQAERYFAAALQAPEAGLLDRTIGAVGQWKAAARRGAKPTLSLPNAEKTPSFEVWRAAANFWQGSDRPDADEKLRYLLGRIKACGRPEWRLSLYELLAHFFKDKREEWGNRFHGAAEREFQAILAQLSEEQRMDYEKNREPKSLDEALDDLLPAAAVSSPPPAGAAGSNADTRPQISESRFRQFSEINRQISQKNNMPEILERVMDAAIELTGAERGFLLLKKDGAAAKGISGFDVKTARHINQRSLQEKDFQFSLTAVEQAIQQGAALLTDNAQLDPRFQERQSVVQYQLKSILSVPLEIEGQILGAIYLDHRYQPGCFSDEDVVLLNAFASQAALAIQKAKMIEELRLAKQQLEVKVEDQAKEIESLHGELAMVRDELKFEYKEIVGQSPPMMQVFQLLDHVTETTIPVWILGESGTGKELIAHALHNNSPRRSASFVSENCSAIPETLLESELFGHKKGAFTHADRDRVGLFEQASNGTLFLDEIADMPMSMQVKLLRVLQEGEVRPLGSNKKVQIDVRLVTASNRDLNHMVKEGKFRQDLFFRINGLTIKLPPLRERKDDIPLLVNHMIEKIARSYNLKPSEVSDDAFQKLLHYPWPGNIRELEGVVRNALLFAKGRLITADLLSIPDSKQASGSPLPAAMGGRAMPSEEESAERQFILDALKRHDLDKEKAANELGISLRSLYTRMEKLNIPKKKTVLAKYLG